MPSPDGGGAVAQLGERLNGIEEADGSIPFSSTGAQALPEPGQTSDNRQEATWVAGRPEEPAVARASASVARRNGF